LQHNKITAQEFAVKLNISGEKPGLVVWAEDSHPIGCGFKSCRILGLADRAFGLIDQTIFQTNQVIKMINLKVNEN
jgi:hypothetical protein